jgi:hypothetical protein
MMRLAVRGASEEVTKTWVRHKGGLFMRKPRLLRLSFTAYFIILFALTLGFVSGFIIAGITLQDNFSSVYESLLLELEIARTCFERERLNSLD